LSTEQNFIHVNIHSIRLIFLWFWDTNEEREDGKCACLSIKMIIWIAKIFYGKVFWWLGLGRYLMWMMRLRHFERQWLYGIFLVRWVLELLWGICDWNLEMTWVILHRLFQRRFSWLRRVCYWFTRCSFNFREYHSSLRTIVWSFDYVDPHWTLGPFVWLYGLSFDVNNQPLLTLKILAWI